MYVLTIIPNLRNISVNITSNTHITWMTHGKLSHAEDSLVKFAT